jgi:hypothetical protein
MMTSDFSFRDNRGAALTQDVQGDGDQRPDANRISGALTFDAKSHPAAMHPTTNTVLRWDPLATDRALFIPAGGVFT